MEGTSNAVVEAIHTNAATHYDIDTVARVAWASITDPGNPEVGKLIQERGAVAALTAVLDPEIDSIEGIHLGRLRSCLGPRTTMRVAQSLKATTENGWSIITPLSASWPKHCDDLQLQAPVCLWVAGNPGLLNGATLGFVGSTTPTEHGFGQTLTLGSALADKGWVLVASTSHGIDTAVHRSARAAKAGSVTVLPCGVDQAYPSGQGVLQTDLVQAGAVLSELAPGTVPTAERRARRNQLLAALCSKVVVVDAEVDCDATVIGEQGRLVGRHVGVLAPTSPDRERSGCRQLRRWFGARNVNSVVDIDRL